MLLFDDLVGSTEQWQRELHTECQRRLEIDCELHFCVLLDRQLGRIETPQNFPGVNTNQPARIQQAWAVTHHAANSDVLSPWIDGWYGMLGRQRNKLLTLPMKEKIGADEKRLGSM